MVEVASEVAPCAFDAPGEGVLDRLRVGVFTVAGRHMGDVEMDCTDTVLDLKREIRLITGHLHFKLVCGTTILEEEDTVEKAGLYDNPIVQLIVLADERFAMEGESCVAGLYLLHDGIAEAFSCTKRIVNRQEDEEHYQRILWGSWSTIGDCVVAVFTDFERNVFNEAAMAGWTSRSGRKPLPTPCSLELLREEGFAHLISDGSLADALGQQFPATLERLSHGEECMFDAWHLAGTPTVP